jgi:hypothetical protein
MKKKKTTTSWSWILTATAICCCCCLSRASIDIKTLPPDLRWLGGVATAQSPALLPRISPEWAGDHSAVLDGDQGRVILSWTINGDVVDFMVSIPLCAVHCKEPILYVNWKQIFPEKELRGHSPNFHIHVPVSYLHIPTIDLPILLQEICGTVREIYQSLTDTRNWD